MSEDRIVSLGDLPPAVTATGTDSFAVCQNPEGCGTNDTLAQMTLEQVSQFVVSQIPVTQPPQFIHQVVPSSNRVALSSDTMATVVTLDIPAGKWLVHAEAWFDLISGNASNVMRLAATLAPDTNYPADPAVDRSVTITAPSNVGVGCVLPLGWVYLDTADPVTYYLNVSASWNGSIAMAAYGKITGLSQ